MNRQSPKLDKKISDLIQITPGRKGALRKPRNIMQTIKLRKAGLSCQEIGEIQNISRCSVQKDLVRLKDIIPDNATIESLDKVKIPALKGTLAKMVIALNNPDKIENASLNNVAYALTQVHSALRLEEGKSTSNISYADSLRALKLAKDELKKLNESNTPNGHLDDSVPYTIPVVSQVSNTITD